MDQWTMVKELEDLKKRVAALEKKATKASAPAPVETKKSVKKSTK